MIRERKTENEGYYICIGCICCAIEQTICDLLDNFVFVRLVVSAMQILIRNFVIAFVEFSFRNCNKRR